jgi:hypothetical protein
VTFLVKKVRNDLPGLAIAEGQRDWAVVVVQRLPVGIAGVDDVFGVDVADNFLREMTDDMLGAPIPETDALFPINDVDSCRQLFQHRVDEARIIE